ncbi:hypothetical protein SAMN04244572_01137 [Azotobacter beijerinckii]|uniref:Uncharacterized protein n=1 Tax=Azotobacter beijerinckii TaxID=170623 RepID=A0A1H6SHY0_9GAMM|nr:hypothetical protein [Azotobacter beijerinckii]SEI63630.1 hypothetical protein SAMN04244572_01137 [Azotobacter beijerinckii]
MPEHKHTGGPWRVDSTFTRYAIKSPSHDIALVALSPQHAANACLISAAPDLLEALQYAIQQVPELETVPGIAAAIAKATGQA